MAKLPDLPARPPRLVGRRRQLHKIRELLYWGRFHEVLKIIGPAGIGKTALVREELEHSEKELPFRFIPLWFSFSEISKDLESFDKILFPLLTGDGLEDLRPYRR